MFEIKTDLSGWVTKFLNGRKPSVNIAGPIKLPESVADYFDMKAILEASTEEAPSLSEIDSLEQILNRRGIIK